MKTLPNRQLLLPVGAAVLALTAGHFSLAPERPLTAATLGYRYVSPSNPCDPVKLCENSNTGALCRVIDADPASPQLYGKAFPSDPFCSTPLYRLF